MSTKYWRFAYDEELLPTILASGNLFFPDFKRWPSAKNDTRGKVIGKLRKGHFVLLANFDRTSGIGTVRGVGLITGKDGEDFLVEWKKPVPGWDLTPDIRGGVKQWLTEGAFNFAAAPAKRYKLESRTQKLFTIG